MTMGTPRHPVPAALVGKRGRKVSHITASSLVRVASRIFPRCPDGGHGDALGMRGQGAHFDALSCL